MNIGLCFVSRYVLDRYSPTIPVQKSWIPLTMKMMHTSDGQPDTGSPQIRVLTMMTSIMRNDSIQKHTPTTDARDSGATEKPVIPSSE